MRRSIRLQARKTGGLHQAMTPVNEVRDLVSKMLVKGLENSAGVTEERRESNLDSKWAELLRKHA